MNIIHSEETLTVLLFFPNTSLSLFPGLSGRDDSVSKRLLSDLPLLIRQSLRDGARSSAFHSARDLRRITAKACRYPNCAEEPDVFPFRSIAADFCGLKFLAENEGERKAKWRPRWCTRNVYELFKGRTQADGGVTSRSREIRSSW